LLSRQKINNSHKLILTIRNLLKKHNLDYTLTLEEINGQLQGFNFDVGFADKNNCQLCGREIDKVCVECDP